MRMIRKKPVVNLLRLLITWSRITNAEISYTEAGLFLGCFFVRGEAEEARRTPFFPVFKTFVLGFRLIFRVAS
jgi:hypothetical protein